MTEDHASSESRSIHDRMLLLHLRWVTSLRWLVGVALAIAGAVNVQWLHWYPHGARITGVGCAVLVYNAALWVLLRRWRSRDGAVIQAWLQMLLDIVSLTALVLFTGGLAGPAVGFYVLHMVFASMLLPQGMAYALAVLATFILAGTLGYFGEPRDLLLSEPEGRMVLGWFLTLIGTVFLTDRIAGAVRRHQTALANRNRRIRDLARRIRSQQQAMVQHEKSVAMGQMAAGVAHEIANPLASLDGVLQLMQRRKDVAAGDKIDTLLQQVDRIKRIVSQLTDFAHPTETNWQVLPVDDVIQRGVELACYDRRHKGIDIAVESQTQDLTLRMQPHAVEHVLVNLLINAFDALHGHSAPRVVVRSTVDGATCRIAVIDNGPGFGDDAAPRLFEPFYTTKPVGQGTGLGLAISDSLIRNAGGSIACEATPGSGATFTVVLPIAPAAQAGTDADTDDDAPTNGDASGAHADDTPPSS